MATTTQAPCPGICCGGKCGGELVGVKRTRGARVGIKESRPTLTFAPCSVLIAQGWTGKVGHVAWDDEREAGTVLRHRDGLVAFG